MSVVTRRLIKAIATHLSRQTTPRSTFETSRNGYACINYGGFVVITLRALADKINVSFEYIEPEGPHNVAFMAAAKEGVNTAIDDATRAVFGFKFKIVD